MRIDHLPVSRGSTAARGMTRRQVTALGVGAVVTAGAVPMLIRIASNDPPSPPLLPPRPQHIAVMVDYTDPLTLNQQQALATAYRALLAKLAVGDALSFDGLVPSEKSPLHPEFSGTVPDPGANANPLLQNGNLMKGDYDDFNRKAEDALLAVAAVKHGTRTSPIVEALWALTKRGPIDQIHLWSDMVNCSGTVNHFKRFSTFGSTVTRTVYLTGLAPLKGARVTINQLAINTAYQTRQLRRWWDAYWTYAGVTDVSWAVVPA
jgi:hypothetical protein